MNMRKGERGSAGFTLIEMMVTLAVVAVLLSAGIPTFSTLIKNNRLVTENYALRSVLSVARSEAQTQRTTVTVCRSANAINCSPGGDWGVGYIAFIDLDNDQQFDEADGEQLLQSRVQDTVGVVVRYSEDALFFDSNGNAVGSNGTFTFCDDRGVSEARGIIVSAVGSVRASVASDAEDSTHIVQDHDGNDVTCS